MSGGTPFLRSENFDSAHIDSVRQLLAQLCDLASLVVPTWIPSCLVCSPLRTQHLALKPGCAAKIQDEVIAFSVHKHTVSHQLVQYVMLLTFSV